MGGWPSHPLDTYAEATGYLTDRMRTSFVKKFFFIAVVAGVVIGVYLVATAIIGQDRQDQLHYEFGETELRVSNLSHAVLTLFKAGKSLLDTTRIQAFDGKSAWLATGNYFLRPEESGRTSYVPISLTGYRSGPDEDGSFVVTLRSMPKECPPRLVSTLPDFIYIPSGNSLLGDRANPREPHYVWLSGFFVAPFEATNGEFRQFLTSPDGYADDSQWSDDGRKWRTTDVSHSSALLTPRDPDYVRFGRDDQPITWVTWYEANAFCRWMTRKIGAHKWLYTLPNDAEWEKVARGPDYLDYALSMTVSDPEVALYNWKKNPDATVTVIGIQSTHGSYQPNRFGVYHMTGNVVEWTQSLNRPFNREHPFVDDDRNLDEAVGLRTARGGSWYSAATSYLYIPYRDSFQPEHSSQDIGFRIVAKALP